MSKDELIEEMISCLEGIQRLADNLTSGNAPHTRGNLRLYCGLALGKLKKEKDNQKKE